MKMRLYKKVNKISARCFTSFMSAFQPLVLSGPSGSGKSTLLDKLFAEFDNCFAFSVSHTTRKPRPGEVHGKHYFFTTKEEMSTAIRNNGFLEHAEFADNMYGTSKQAVKDVQATNRICILDIDMQGVINLKKTDLKPRYIFIQPPSVKSLEERLRARGTETEESLQKRLARAKADMDYANTPGVYDHVIINDDIDTAYGKLRDILIKDINAIKARKQK